MRNITVVRGGNGCGKSTFAAALAGQLARSGVHTLLISPDTHIPAFGLWAVKRESVSFGKVLEGVQEKVNLAASIYIFHGLKENLGLLGFLPHEAEDKYTPASEETASEFFRLVSELADQVVVDGTVYGDTVTGAAEKAARLQIKLIEPDPRGFLSATSEPPGRGGGDVLWIACPHGTDDPVEEAAERLHINFSAKLPRTPEAHIKLTEGRLFQPYKDKRYRAAVELAARAVLEGAV